MTDSNVRTADFLMASRMRDAARGSVEALYDLGVTYSTGTNGVATDLIAAHKWFNLAAASGLAAAQDARGEVAEDMTAREIAEAQRQARAWLGTGRARMAA